MTATYASRLCVVLVSLGASVGILATSSKADPPAGFQQEQLLGGLIQPISLGFLPDGRMLVLQRGGQIFISDVTREDPTASPYLDVPFVDSSLHVGLLDIAIPHDFQDSQVIYLYYSNQLTGYFQIDRFDHLGDTADPESAHTIWQDTQPIHGIAHYGGGLSMGPDNLLYLSVGEEASSAQAQNLERSGGSMIRIRPDGLLPIDNPFMDGPGGNDDSIWAYGLRNPFRAEWDLPRAHLWIADVGAQTAGVLYLGDHGVNYGWPYCEGVCDEPGRPKCDCKQHSEGVFILPHIGSSALIGGEVYRGNQFPSDPYYGAYFYGDFSRRFIRYLTFDESGTQVTGDHEFEPDAGAVVAIAEGTDGALYSVNYLANYITRYVFPDDNLPPQVVDATASYTSGPSPLTVSFDAVAVDPEDQSLTYRWWFGDGGDAVGATVNHSYQQDGAYQAYVEASDGTATSLSGPLEIIVGTRPTANILSPSDGQSFVAGDQFTLTADVFDAEEELGMANYNWFIRHVRDGVEQVVAGPLNQISPAFTVPTSGLDFSGESWLEIGLTLIDSSGLCTTESITILPDTIDLSLTTEPAGLNLLIDGTTVTTPHVAALLVAGNVQLHAPSQCTDGSLWAPVSWSNGLDITHFYTVPETDAALSATFDSDGEPSPDINGNGVIETQDLIEIILSWGVCQVEHCAADLDCDGQVGATDLILVILNWGK